MSIVIVVTLIAGVVLGMIWRWHMVGLIFSAIGVGLIAGACVTDWSGFKSLFSTSDAFISVSLNYGGFFLLLIAPAFVGALGTFLLKNYVRQKGN